MSKIIIGFNSFKPCDRNFVALDSWNHLKQQQLVHDVVDVQFVGDLNHEHVTTIDQLRRDSSMFVDNSTKKLPVVKDVLDILADQSCDYFIFTNSDVIINKNLIKHINKHKPQAFACSRMNINQIESFDNVLNQKITPTRYEVAGFDTFVFQKEWYLDNNHIFNDYLIGMPVWDVVYAGMIKLFAGNHPLGNQNPPFCFHVEHDITWQHDPTAPERVYNRQLLEQTHLDKLVFSIFDKYIVDVLIKRQPNGAFMIPHHNETDIEQQYFNNFK